MKRISVLLAALLLSFNVFALDLKTAKANGIVGETQSGYLAAVQANPSTETLALVKQINQKRKVAYTKSATKAGVALNVMETRISQRLYERAAAGAFLKDSQGNWYRK